MTLRKSIPRTLALIALVFGPSVLASGTSVLAERPHLSLADPTIVLYTASEALAEGSHLDEEFYALTTQLQQQLLKGKQIEHVLQALEPDERTRFRDYLVGELEVDPDFDAWEAHFRWQNLAALVYHLDAGVYEQQVEARAILLAKQHVNRIERVFREEAGQLPMHFRGMVLDVYKTLIISPPGVAGVCKSYLRAIESRFMQMEIQDLRQLVQNERDVIFAEIVERRERASSWLTDHVKKDKQFRYGRGRYTYSSMVKGERRKWVLEMDTIFPGAGYDGFLTFRSKNEKRIAVTVRSDDFIAMHASGAIDSLLHSVVGNNTHKPGLEESLSDYDLPENQQTAYLRFLPRSYGAAEFGFLLSSFVRSAALAHRYGDRFIATDIIFTNALQDSLGSVLKRVQDQGISSVILEFDSHGEQNGFSYGETPFSPAAVTELIGSNPNVKFLIRTPACYGGKLRDALMEEIDKNRSLRGRVAFFAQSKPETPNVLYYGSVLDASVYDVFLLQNLLDTDITSYGEAAARAGNMTRRVYWTDAEVVYQGQLSQ